MPAGGAHAEGIVIEKGEYDKDGWNDLIDPDTCSDSEPDRWFKVAPLVCDCGACWYCLNKQGAFPHPLKIAQRPLCMY